MMKILNFKDKEKIHTYKWTQKKMGYFQRNVTLTDI